MRGTARIEGRREQLEGKLQQRYGFAKDQIRKDVSEGMEKSQREFILRQQLAAIRKELGEGEDGESAIDAYREKAESGKLPEAVKAAVEREIGRL